ncbi:MAG: hypothetical protein JNK57_12435 [Planctomycetaceae bacterium]|nr:hypothetical protein [Planctomycetaceae bacterium]
MATEDKLTMTQTNPDGSQSILEITSKTLSPEEVNADPSLFEMIIDAIFDSGDDEHETYLVPEGYMETATPFESSESFGGPAWDSATTPDFGATMPSDAAISPLGMNEMGTMPSWSPEATTAFTPATELESTWATEASDLTSTEPQEDHAQAARDAQAAADEFINNGDYLAAQEAREQAESAADLAGDHSMLSLYDSQDLEFAAEKQDLADHYRQEQTDLIAQGDYEGAREAALQSGYATGDADSLAGGSDHTGQADRDVQSLDWSVWNEKNADANVFNAEQAAADGNFEQAEMYADQAGWQQATADQYADQANPDSLQWNYDPSATVDSGGSYDALNSIDTGFTPTTDYGSGTDYSSGTDDMTV